MTLLIWKPAYNLGIPAVDQEHRDLIAMINRAYQAMEDAAGAAQIEACLEDIHAGIAAHFALEERYMREAGYAEYQAHKDDHEELLDQIRAMMDVFADSPQRGRDVLRKRLSDWFTVHFATFDARLHEQLGSHA